MSAWAAMRRKRDYTVIDPKILTLVDGMNATGAIRTLASCQGHMDLYRAPYVYFKSSVAIAAAIERVLRETAHGKEANTRLGWTVEGRFDADYELAFRLHSPELEWRSRSLLDVAWYFGLNRKRLDSDLSALVEIVKQAVVLEVGNEHEPQVAAQGHQYGDRNEFAGQG